MKHKPHHLLATLVLLLATSGTVAAESLSPEQLEKKKAYFLKFDADGDQCLSQFEFTAMVRKQFESKNKEGWGEVGAERFARNDLDTDGKVTFEEWLSEK
jgi:Ca2+-binding EF-hand superfamily protein